jgi:hypothetical protein
VKVEEEFRKSTSLVHSSACSDGEIPFMAVGLEEQEVFSREVWAII